MSQTANGHEIYVSYAWKGESERIVDQLCQAFAIKGYKITRDKSAMAYKDSIKDFMDRIGRGRFIIAVINDKYMKSEYCMYEAYRVFQSPFFRERVFPIVLADADIFSIRGQAAYLKYWQAEYKSLEKEYRSVADSSPTMAAPMAERLRDIEVTTRFINDFMAAVSDMNVLTSQIHTDSDFDQLISAIQMRMMDMDSKRDMNMSKPSSIEPGGGTYIGGNLNTAGGDFVGRDKHVYGTETSIRVGRNVSGSNIIAGNNNIVATNLSAQNVFISVYAAIEESALTVQDKEDLTAEIQEIEAAINQNSSVDEMWFTRRLRNLKKIAPDIAQVALSALTSPNVNVATVVKEIAKRVKAEQ